MSNGYDHKQIETKWRAIWEKTGLFQNTYFDDEQNSKVTPENKLYVLPQLPYPSGDGLHMGHAEGYTACDIFARFNRMKGKQVLQVMGWDAFGLPAENYAIKTNIHPRINTDRAIDNFRNQIKSLGISVDWSREVGSHQPEFYKWTQWFFLFLYERGLAYRKKQDINWCDGCKTVLANEQVVDNKCERCGTEVVQKEMEQWFFKITDYADRLYDDLDKVDWPSESVKRQRDWIGRSEGAEISFPINHDAFTNEGIKVFTTRPDTIFGVKFMVLAPEHPLVKKYLSSTGVDAKIAPQITEYVEKVKHITELQRQTNKQKTGVYLGIDAINPANNEKIPVYISDYVLMGYGHGAIMGVPGHDDRDFEFAKAFGLEVAKVIEQTKIEIFPDLGLGQINKVNSADTISISKPNMKTHVLFGSSEIIEERASQLGIKPGKTLYAGHGKIINSDYLNGLDSNENKDEVINRLLSNGVDIIHKKVFKLRDWSISRQRFWGAPIPMVYDPEGNIHPVHKDDLPVILPDDVDFHPTGKSPLTYSTSFQEGVEEKYGKGWKREVDTLDTFMCSSWYYFRYLDPKNENEFASKEVLRRWMPVDFYIGGPEHVTGHLLYSRFFTKVLFDAGYINFDEPFKFHRHQGLILGEDGRRMSKRWGNVINPTQMVEEYGADAARVFEMFMGPLEATKPWDTHGVRGIKRFLSRIYDLATDTEKSLAETSTPELKVLLNSTVKKVQEDYEKLKYNTAIAKLMELINLWDKKGNSFCKSDTINFIKLIAPLAPFISEELYYFIMNKKFVTSKLEEVENFDQSIHVQSWAEYDSKLETKEDINIVVSVDGKVRGVLKNIDKNQNKDQIIDLAKSLVQKYISEKTIVDVIYVENKVVNIVT